MPVDTPLLRKAADLFRRLLGRETFDWAREGEALPHRHKQAYYARPVRPQTSPVSDRVAQACGVHG